VYRYERLFTEFLTSVLPDVSPLVIVSFAASVTSGHNYLLREMLRGNPDATRTRLRRELAAIRGRLARARGTAADGSAEGEGGAAGGGRAADPADAVDGNRVVVVVADGAAGDDAITAAVRTELDRARRGAGARARTDRDDGT